MGFFGDLCSGIGSAISSACSAVGSFVSGCVSAVSSAVGSVCKGAAEVCSTVMKGVEKVSDSLGAIGQIALTLCNPALGAIMAVVSTVSSKIDANSSILEIAIIRRSRCVRSALFS